MTKRTDLIDKRFGKLTVVKYSHSEDFKSGKKAMWNVICDCGKINSVLAANLVSGKVKSCGCTNTERLKKPYGESCINSFYCHYRHDAKSRDRKFELDFLYFKKLILEDCYYCGAKPSLYKDKKRMNGNVPMNGIDRVNSKLGYTKENIVTCCTKCNRMKTNFDVEDFISHIRKIYEFSCVSVCKDSMAKSLK